MKGLGYYKVTAQKDGRVCLRVRRAFAWLGIIVVSSVVLYTLFEVVEDTPHGLIEQNISHA